MVLNSLILYIQFMVSRKPRIALQQIQRTLKYSFSCLLSMMFSPNYIKIFYWWQILLVFTFIAFMIYMLSLSR